ncbi:MAG: hypothetical protein N2Z69_02785 [Methylophilaceae bacterium]|nr:hypothetical protein [Methylophilaceae bacterium]
MMDPSLFLQYLELSEQLLQLASRDDLIQCLHVLATSVSFYEAKFGPLPHDALVALLKDESPGVEQVELLTHTLKTMVDALGQVIQPHDSSH